jgi:hypothetical protein
MSFTVKSLAEPKQAMNVDSAGEATDAVSALQKQTPGAVKVEIHREHDSGDDALTASLNDRSNVVTE